MNDDQPTQPNPGTNDEPLLEPGFDGELPETGNVELPEPATGLQQPMPGEPADEQNDQ